jgi:hypothetical protein
MHGQLSFPRYPLSTAPACDSGRRQGLRPGDFVAPTVLSPAASRSVPPRPLPGPWPRSLMVPSLHPNQASLAPAGARRRWSSGPNAMPSVEPGHRRGGQSTTTYCTRKTAGPIILGNFCLALSPITTPAYHCVSAGSGTVGAQGPVDSLCPPRRPLEPVVAALDTTFRGASASPRCGPAARPPAVPRGQKGGA